MCNPAESARGPASSRTRGPAAYAREPHTPTTPQVDLASALDEIVAGLR